MVKLITKMRMMILTMIRINKKMTPEILHSGQCRKLDGRPQTKRIPFTCFYTTIALSTLSIKNIYKSKRIKEMPIKKFSFRERLDHYSGVAKCFTRT